MPHNMLHTTIDNYMSNVTPRGGHVRLRLQRRRFTSPL